MLFTERPCPRLWAVLILLLATPMALLLAGPPAMSIYEAELAVRAAALAGMGPWGSDAIFGQALPGVWLQDWLTAAIASIIGFTELSVRLPQALLLLVLAAVCAWGSGKVAGAQAGAVSAAAAVSSAYSFQLIDRAGNQLLAGVLLSTAWLCWFRFSREKKRWNYAWIVAHTCVLFAIITMGPIALVLFYAPLVFLRSPLRIRRRLWMPDHFVSLAILLTFSLLWIFGNTTPNATLREIGDTLEWRFDFWRNLWHLVATPFLAALAFLPWSFLAWPGFCHAFRHLEREPVFARMLRTVILTVFGIGWIFPVEGMTFAPALGPLCMLIGLNYEILVRRHGQQLLLIPRVLGVAAIPLVLTVLAASWLHDPAIVPRSGTELMLSILLLLMAAVLGRFVHKRQIPGPVWLQVLLGVVVLRLAWCGSVQIYRGQTGSPERATGLSWRAAVPEGEVVYWLEKPGRYPRQTFYLRRECRHLLSDLVIPKRDNTVYLLSREEPVSSGRSWKPLVAGKERVPTLWKGQLELFEVRPPLPLVGRNANEELLETTQFTLVNQQASSIVVLEFRSQDPGLFASGVLPATIEPGQSGDFSLRLNKLGEEAAPGRRELRVVLLIDDETTERLMHVQLHSPQTSEE